MENGQGRRRSAQHSRLTKIRILRKIDVAIDLVTRPNHIVHVQKVVADEGIDVCANRITYLELSLGNHGENIPREMSDIAGLGKNTGPGSARGQTEGAVGDRGRPADVHDLDHVAKSHFCGCVEIESAIGPVGSAAKLPAVKLVSGPKGVLDRNQTPGGAGSDGVEIRARQRKFLLQVEVTETPKQAQLNGFIAIQIQQAICLGAPKLRGKDGADRLRRAAWLKSGFTRWVADRERLRGIERNAQERLKIAAGCSCVKGDAPAWQEETACLPAETPIFPQPTAGGGANAGEHAEVRTLIGSRSE